MAVLVLNSGSSTLKYGVFGENGAAMTRGTLQLHGGTAADAAIELVQRLRKGPVNISAVGHRVVHGGDEFSGPVVLDDKALEILEKLSPLAPLHNPVALGVIRAAEQAFGASTPQVAVFDTAFFAGLPDASKTYALPARWHGRSGARRYGFHGIAHRSMYE